MSRESRTTIAAVLNEGERRLFYQQPLSGQRHGLRVMERLRRAGHQARPLLAAALLHDIGKTRYSYRWWDRSLVVAIDFLWPEKAAEWGQHSERPNRLQRPFVVKRHHPAWGAEAAAAVGSCAQTVALIAGHQERVEQWEDDETARMLRSLQWADDLS
ncbi:MAG: HD domain-containing protein [Candidatus Promineifilaceae bacterium]|nr:HD domain-containing protein [Candidatus Promineifilaceae bacterium]